MQWVVAGVVAFVLIDAVAIARLWWGSKHAVAEPRFERRTADRRASVAAWSGPERRRAERRQRSARPLRSLA
jgi:hypothetical protein